MLRLGHVGIQVDLFQGSQKRNTVQRYNFGLLDELPDDIGAEHQWDISGLLENVSVNNGTCLLCARLGMARYDKGEMGLTDMMKRI